MPAKLDLRQIPKFNVGHAAELNFVGEALKKLPASECRAIYDGLHAPHSSRAFEKAMVVLLNIIAKAPEEELTEYINRVLGAPFNGYLFVCTPGKAHLFAAFFFNHLRRDGRKFTVERINLETLAVA